MVLYNNSHKTLEQHCCYKKKSKENHTSEAAWIKMVWDALCNDTGQSEDNDIQCQDSLVRSGVAASALLSCLLVLILAAAFAFKDEDACHLPCNSEDCSLHHTGLYFLFNYYNHSGITSPG